MIVQKYGGEQPVGTSEIVKTGHPRIPYVAHAPTMYIPEMIRNPRILYNVMWAIMLSVYDHNRMVLQNPNSGHTFISSVLCTTLGTGVGGVGPEEAATQHVTALTNFYNRYDLFEYTVVQRKLSKARMNPKEDLFLLKWSWGIKRFEVFTKEAWRELQRMQEALRRMF
ncbi:hypothetical protein BKA69DRAFT_1079601 [Paraphysoderma sedebokerense]|nr:hypothetical protein BKA69DRAFT_1079601 [Paraphysoderma sedebokerense]